MEKNELLQKLNQACDLIIECLEGLGKNGERASIKAVRSGGKKRGDLLVGVDFEKPIRPFVKEYVKDKSGPKKFTLLVAYLTKGDVSQSVLLSEVKKQWNKMKSLLGGDFNRFYSSQARDKDWVYSPKQGLYTLRPKWKDALN